MYNIHATYLTQSGRTSLTTHLQRLRPSLVVVMDDPAYAHNLCQLLPSTSVVHRTYMGDATHTRINPQAWIDQHRWCAETGVWAYHNNEPPLDNASITDALAVARLALQVPQLKVVLLNLSVGMPHAWDPARELIQLVGQHPDRLAIGLHEYAPALWTKWLGDATAQDQWIQQRTQPAWLMGRHHQLVDYCRKEGLPVPRVAITEWGFDRIFATEEWQQALPRTGGYTEISGVLTCPAVWDTWKRVDQTWQGYLFDQLQAAWNVLYRPYPNIMGVALFCYGAQGHWERYDYQHLHEFKALLEQGNFGGQLSGLLARLSSTLSRLGDALDGQFGHL